MSRIENPCSNVRVFCFIFARTHPCQNVNKKNREIYRIPRHYLVPLAAGIVMVVAGIVMSFLDHNAYGKSEEYNTHLEITGPQTIVLGSIIILYSMYYMRKLRKETDELNRRQ